MKFYKIVSIVLFLCAPEFLKSQLAAPTVGYVRLANGAAYGVYGLEGNYVLGDSVLGSLQAASFSNQGAFVARPGSLTLLSPDLTAIASWNCEESAPLVHMQGDRTTAIAWLPAAHQMVHWDGQSFQAVDASGFAAAGSVTSINKVDESTASLLVLAADNTVTRYLVSLHDGSVNSSAVLAGVRGRTFEDGPRILWLADHKLTAATHTGDPLKTFQLAAGDLSIEYAASNCLHLSSKISERDWLLHTTDNDLRLYELPRPHDKKLKPLRTMETAK